MPRASGWSAMTRTSARPAVEEQGKAAPTQRRASYFGRLGRQACCAGGVLLMKCGKRFWVGAMRLGTDLVSAGREGSSEAAWRQTINLGHRRRCGKAWVVRDTRVRQRRTPDDGGTGKSKQLEDVEGSKGGGGGDRWQWRGGSTLGAWRRKKNGGGRWSEF